MKRAGILIPIFLLFGAGAWAAGSVGVVKVVKGDVQLTTENGTPKALVPGDQIHEHDRIATDQTSAALIEFLGGNKMQIFKHASVVIQEYDPSDVGRRVVIQLQQGKIRNQVRQDFDGKNNRYQVLTKGVSAVVRGTADFFLEQEVSNHVVTRAEVLAGGIDLNQRAGEKSVRVERGHLVTFVLNDAEGTFNPVRKLTIPEFESLYKVDLDDRSAHTQELKIVKTDVSAAPPSPHAEIICKKPNARLNQCVWRCVNNPKKAKTCQVEKSNVSCVRLRCNANGDWAEETKLPVGESDKCKAKGEVVDDCDY